MYFQICVLWFLASFISSQDINIGYLYFLHVLFSPYIKETWTFIDTSGMLYKNQIKLKIYKHTNK